MASAPAAGPRTTDILPRRRVVGYAMGDWEPTDEGRYHLIIDSSQMSLDEAVEEVVAAVEAERAMVDLDLPEEPEGD